MNLEPGLLSESTPVRMGPAFGSTLDRPSPNFPAVLIRVPRVSLASRAARRPSAAATERVRSHAAVGLPRRRRLRKPFRTAGYVVASVLPLLVALAALHGSPASTAAGVPDGRGHTRTAAAAAFHRRPTVSLSIDAGLMSPRGEDEVPVVLPGYLLPDDGAEDSHDAGG